MFALLAPKVCSTASGSHAKLSFFPHVKTSRSSVEEAVTMLQTPQIMVVATRGVALAV